MEVWRYGTFKKLILLQAGYSAQNAHTKCFLIDFNKMSDMYNRLMVHFLGIEIQSENIKSDIRREYARLVELKKDDSLLRQAYYCIKSPDLIDSSYKCDKILKSIDEVITRVNKQ